MNKSRTAIVLRHAPGSALYFSRGGLATLAAAETVRRMGRRGDTLLIHVNPSEMRELRRRWGEPSINPYTGLPEYGFMSKAFKKVKKGFKKAVGAVKKVLKSPIMQAVLPVALNFVAPGLGVAIGGALGATGTAASVVGNAVLSGAIGGATGGKKGALAGALAGGVGAGFVGKGALQKAMANAVAGGVGSEIRGGKFIKGALTAGATSALGSALAPKATPQVDGAYDPTMNVAAEADSAVLDNNQVMGSYEQAPDYSGYGSGTPAPAFTPGGIEIDQPVIDVGSVAPTAPEYDLPNFWEQTKTNVINNAKEHPIKTTMGALSLVNALNKPKQQKPPDYSEGEYGQRTPLPQLPFNRQQTIDNAGSGDYYTYGQRPEQVWYQGNQLPDNAEDEQNPYMQDQAYSGYARGGPLQAAAGPSVLLDPRPSFGPGDGREDLIDAKLSDGEYVIDAETVALLGNGSSKAGAQRLDQFREEVRRHKGQALSKGKFSPDAKAPLQYLKGKAKAKKVRGAR